MQLPIEHFNYTVFAYVFIIVVQQIKEETCFCLWKLIITVFGGGGSVSSPSSCSSSATVSSGLGVSAGGAGVSAGVVTELPRFPRFLPEILAIITLALPFCYLAIWKYKRCGFPATPTHEHG